jgi:hypothetical protein
MSLILLATLAGFGAAADGNTFAGRWAIESADATRKVFWLEVTSVAPVEGNFFGVTGGRLAPLRNASIEGGLLRFRVERVFDAGRRAEGAIELRLRNGEALEGSVHAGDRTFRVSGRRPRAIADRDDGSWRAGETVALLQSGLDRWRPYERRGEEWAVENGVLSNRSAKANLLVTKADYWNFRLRLDYKLPKGGNAGIGLRHHYELQLADDYGLPPDVHGNAALYSQIAPSVNASRPANEWQTIEITLIGRDLTVVLNGVKVIDRQAIRGLTGLALDADESKPGPVSLQGDHGPVGYRNIAITPLLRK